LGLRLGDERVDRQAEGQSFVVLAGRHARRAVVALGESSSATVDHTATFPALGDADVGDSSAVHTGVGGTLERIFFEGDASAARFGIVGDVDAVLSASAGPVSAFLVSSCASRGEVTTG